MSAKIYNHSTKQWELVNDAEVDEKIRAGTHTFQAGITIPVVAEDGEVIDIPSEKLHEAFNDGFRWVTPADVQADLERKQAASKERISGDQFGSAFAGGVLNTVTMGGADAALRLGEEAGVLPEGITEVRKDTKEMNPGGTVLGSVTGAFVPLPLPKGLGGSTSIAKTGEKLGASAAARVIKPAAEGATKAQQALRGISSKALGSAVEGAFYGAGEGISEAALGNPEDIVDNLSAGISFGALTGGAMGAAFGTAGVAKPFLQSAAAKSADATAAFVDKVARKSVATLGRAALSVTENKQLAKEFGELVHDKAFQQAYQSGGLESARHYDKLVKAGKHEIAREGKQIAKAMEKELKNAEVDVAQSVTDQMRAHGGDLERARQSFYDDILKPAGSAFDDVAATADGPALSADKWVDDFSGLVDRMRDSGYPVLRQKADELEQFIMSRSKLDDQGVIAMSQGDEMHTLKYIKQTLFDRDAIAAAKLNGQAWKLAQEVQDTAKNYLYNYPDASLAQSFQAYDKVYHAYKVFDDVAKTHKGMTFVQPEAVKEIAPILGNLESLSPEISRLRASVNDTAKYAEEMRNLVMKARESHGALVLNDPVSVQAFKDVMGDLVSKPIKGERLSEIAKTLSDIANLTPMEQAVRLQKALGRDASEIEKFLPFQKQAAALERLQGVSAGDTSTTGMLMKSAVGYALGGPAGSLIANASNIASHPARFITTVLPAIEKASNAGAKRLSQAFNGVTNALTSGKVQRAATVGRIKHESITEKRERFKKVMAAVSTNMTPQGAIASITEMAGGTQGLNSLKTSLSNRLQTASLYLDQKAPKDPMAGKSVLVQDSGWMPSDAELSTFMRRVAVVNDPTIAIDKLAEGTVTLEEIDALKMVHPEIYAKLQRNVIDAIIDNGKAIPYQTRLLLGTVFGLPTDYSMTPEFIGKMQSTFATKDQGGRPEGSTEGSSGTPRKKNFDIAPLSTVQTEVSAMTYKDAT